VKQPGEREKIKVALIQMDSKPKEKEHNISHAKELIRNNAVDAEFVCLPELFSTGYNLNLMGDSFYELAETIPGPTTEEFGRLARERSLAILGTIVEADSIRKGVLYDTTFLIDSSGNLAGKYRKTHLYPAEHSYFRPGSKLPVFELEGIKTGVAICFEHAFPQIFTILALKGALMIFIPSAVPTGYEYLLNLRSRARAQDNQLFIAAVNRVGKEGEISFCGLSKIINPRGEVIAEGDGSREQVVVGEIDLNLILKERKQEPFFRAMRPELYRPLVKPL